ncbi:MAG: hypothetical protein U0401_20440 [Anaerolineae bacterium]
MTRPNIPPPPDHLPEDAELARQLFALRRPPSEVLQRHVQTIPRQPPARLLPRHLLGVVAGVCVMLLLFISPPVQATLGQAQKVIGQINLTVQEIWPQPTAAVTMLETEPMSLAVAQAVIPFEFGLPAYVPAGLSRPDDRVTVAKLSTPLVQAEWRDAQGGFVQLSAYAADPALQFNQTVVGPDSSSAILINGQAGVLVRGAWDDASRTWSHQDRMLTLLWANNGVQYRLLAFTSQISLPELVAMAESIK